MLKAIECSTSEISFIDDMALKLKRLKEKREKAGARQSSKAPSKKSQPNPFKAGDLVLKATKSSKLHGSYCGPFLVMSIDSNTSMSIKNLITGHVGKASIHQCKIYQTDLPNDDELHKAVASGDTEEHILVKVLDRYDTPEGEYCTVVWFGGEHSAVSLKDITNTKAYSEFIKLNSNSCNDSTVHRPKKKRVSSEQSQKAKSPVAKRTRNSKREKR
ncbi:hypothetical protein GEMRC1_007804 [Eukaryota sp. GEM-RC1]